jgi:hypothetical protein
MYATLHSVTTLVFLLLKLRGFIVARGYHRSLAFEVLPPSSSSSPPPLPTESADDATHLELVPACAATAAAAGNDGGGRGRLALHRDASMRALHDSHGGGRHDDEGGNTNTNTTTTINKDTDQVRCQAEGAEKRRRGLRELGRMVSCSIRNLCGHLRTRAHVLALLRFVLTQVFPKLALNITRFAPPPPPTTQTLSTHPTNHPQPPTTTQPTWWWWWWWCVVQVVAVPGPVLRRRVV